jgi:hypothetical protein
VIALYLWHSEATTTCYELTPLVGSQATFLWPFLNLTLLHRSKSDGEGDRAHHFLSLSHVDLYENLISFLVARGDPQIRSLLPLAAFG